jgi:hypothetical protein
MKARLAGEGLKPCIEVEQLIAEALMTSRPPRWVKARHQNRFFPRA